MRTGRRCPAAKYSAPASRARDDGLCAGIVAQADLALSQAALEELLDAHQAAGGVIMEATREAAVSAALGTVAVDVPAVDVLARRCNRAGCDNRVQRDTGFAGRHEAGRVCGLSRYIAR